VSKTGFKVCFAFKWFNLYRYAEGRLGEYPRPELRSHGRISTACFDAVGGAAVQVHSIWTHSLQAPGVSTLEPTNCENLVTKYAYKFNSYRYAAAQGFIPEIKVGPL
jgi:hypothetical protein